jgi:hypothetical protein
MIKAPMTPKDEFSDSETQRRTEAALRAAFNTPPKPQSEMKLGKRKASRGKSPAASKRKKSR